MRQLAICLAFNISCVQLNITSLSLSFFCTTKKKKKKNHHLFFSFQLEKEGKLKKTPKLVKNIIHSNGSTVFCTIMKKFHNYNKLLNLKDNTTLNSNTAKNCPKTPILTHSYQSILVLFLLVHHFFLNLSPTLSSLSSLFKITFVSRSLAP